MESPLPRLDRLAIALDTDDRSTFGAWCRRFGPRVGVLKVGLEAYCRWGPGSVEVARAETDRVFLDLKLHDIPNTVAGAVRAVRSLGVSLLTVHAAGGPAMLEAAVEAAEGEVRILAVTLLTHLDESSLARLDLPGSGRDRVLAWSQLAIEAGVDGIVCSPQEAAGVRQRIGSTPLVVTPGIRLRADSAPSSDDQRRVATPREARSAGADLLVVGRPVTRAEDPHAVLTRIADELAD
jgi:orotidine-5'-phosphate decarboxylase